MISPLLRRWTRSAGETGTFPTLGTFFLRVGGERLTSLSTKSAATDFFITWCATWSGLSCWWGRELLNRRMWVQFWKKGTGGRGVGPFLPLGCIWSEWSIRIRRDVACNVSLGCWEHSRCMQDVAELRLDEISRKWPLKLKSGHIRWSQLTLPPVRFYVKSSLRPHRRCRTR